MAIDLIMLTSRTVKLFCCSNVKKSSFYWGFFFVILVTKTTIQLIKTEKMFKQGTKKATTLSFKFKFQVSASCHGNYIVIPLLYPFLNSVNFISPSHKSLKFVCFQEFGSNVELQMKVNICSGCAMLQIYL